MCSLCSMITMVTPHLVPLTPPTANEFTNSMSDVPQAPPTDHPIPHKSTGIVRKSLEGGSGSGSCRGMLWFCFIIFSFVWRVLLHFYPVFVCLGFTSVAFLPQCFYFTTVFPITRIWPLSCCFRHRRTAIYIYIYIYIDSWNKLI